MTKSKLVGTRYDVLYMNFEEPIGSILSRSGTLWEAWRRTPVRTTGTVAGFSNERISVHQNESAAQEVVVADFEKWGWRKWAHFLRNERGEMMPRSQLDSWFEISPMWSSTFEFLEWLEEKYGLSLDFGSANPGTPLEIGNLLDEYHKVDRKKLDDERRELMPERFEEGKLRQG